MMPEDFRANLYRYYKHFSKLEHRSNVSWEEHLLVNSEWYELTRVEYAREGCEDRISASMVEVSIK